MVPAPYIYERQVEYRTSREIEGFFLDSGFEVLVLPITQLTERQVPSDFLFFDGSANKLFGLQFKALYHNADDYWNLDADQHRTLGYFEWMYYGLSDLTSSRQHRNALHYLRVVSPSFSYEARLTRPRLQQLQVPRYVRWAAFFEGVRDCRYGCRVGSGAELARVLWPREVPAAPRELSEIADEVFMANFEGRRTVRFSSAIRPLG
jgi:hypothetical protein